MYIDAVNPDLSSVARFINTSRKSDLDRNNVVFKVSFRGGVPIVNVRTSRAVAPGREFLAPYGNGYHFEEEEIKEREHNTHNTQAEANAGNGENAHIDVDAAVAQLMRGMDMDVWNITQGLPSLLQPPCTLTMCYFLLPLPLSTIRSMLHSIQMVHPGATLVLHHVVVC